MHRKAATLKIRSRNVAGISRVILVVVVVIILIAAAGIGLAYAHNPTNSTTTPGIASSVTPTTSPTASSTTNFVNAQGVVSSDLQASATNASQCSSSSPTDGRPIRIGVLTSLTGIYTDLGQDMVDATNMLVTQINSEGGVYVSSLGGCSLLQVFYADEGDSTQQAVAGMNQLVYSDNPDFIVGGVGTADTTPAENINSGAGIPFIITDATGNTLTTRTDINATWDFIFGETTQYAVQQEVNFLLQDIKPAVAPNSNLTMGDLVEADSVGQLITSSFQNDTNGQGIDFIHSSTQPATQTDVSASLLALENVKPDVVDIQCCGDVAAAQISAIQDFGMGNVPIIDQNGETAAFYSELSAFLAQSPNTNIFMGTEFPAFAVNYSSSVTAFENEAEVTAGAVLGPIAAVQYDAINLVLEAIHSVGTVDKNAVLNALEEETFPAGLLAFPNNEIKVSGVNDFISQFLIEQIEYNSTLKAAVPYVVWPSAFAQRSVNVTGLV